MSTHFLVAYVPHAIGSLGRLLNRYFGPETPTALPRVSSPYDSLEQANADLQTILQQWSLPSDNAILVQPSEEGIAGLSEQVALALIKRDPDWTEFRRRFGEDGRIRAKEYGRCWLVVVDVERGGIPPGTGFVVDKHTRRVFPRRYIDVVSPDGDLP